MLDTLNLLDQLEKIDIVRRNFYLFYNFIKRKKSREESIVKESIDIVD